MVSIESPLAKFNRAEQQLDALRSDLLPLGDLKSYTIIKDIDDVTREQIYSFGKVPPIPDGLGLLVGEILYNFRCSLDHLIWQLVLSEGNIPTLRNEFPIFKDLTKYNSGKRSKLKGVSNTVIPIIDALQPCNSTGDLDYWCYLWYLHELCNADKHRYLLLTRRSLRKNLRLVYISSSNRIPRGVYFDAPVEDGAIFFRIEPDVDVEIHPTIDILFENAPSDIRTDLPVLNIIELIHGSVWKAFEDLRAHTK